MTDDTRDPASTTHPALVGIEPRDRPKVLVVEDDADIRNILQMFLTRARGSR